MAKTNITVRTKKCQDDFYVRYVIVYTNGRTVQGHRIHYLVSKVNVFSQGKVQRVAPTYPVQVSTVEFYHHVGRVLGRQFHSCGELLEKWPF